MDQKLGKLSGRIWSRVCHEGVPLLSLPSSLLLAADLQGPSTLPRGCLSTAHSAGDFSAHSRLIVVGLLPPRLCPSLHVSQPHQGPARAASAECYRNIACNEALWFLCTSNQKGQEKVVIA